MSFAYADWRANDAQVGSTQPNAFRETVFVGAGGAGLDAEAAQLANTRFKRWPGVTRYIAGALWAWRDFRAVEFEAIIDDVPWRGRAMFAAVANGPCYGSGVRIAPLAQMDDGWLDITIVREMPLSAACSRPFRLSCVPAIFAGRKSSASAAAASHCAPVLARSFMAMANFSGFAGNSKLFRKPSGAGSAASLPASYEHSGSQ